MNVLIITRSAWDDTNSSGNTMSNFWSNWDTEKIANLYCREAKPNNNVCFNYFSITEKMIIYHLFGHKKKPGNYFKEKNKARNNSFNTDSEKEEQLYKYFRKNPSIIALWGQSLIWKVGNWKNDILNEFLIGYKPDIIFAPCFSSNYMHKILWYIASKTCAKVVLFHADDYLSTKGLGGNLLIKLNRKLRAKQVIKSALKADLNFCISPKQQQEYEKKLNREMKLLFKGADFPDIPRKYSNSQTRLIRIVYIGSTLYGRWQTLGILANAIYKINATKPVFELHIYSQYEPTEKAKQAMIIDGASKFMGKVPATQVFETMKDADIVLHVESFDESEKLKTRLSFSTKIVDCLASGRCVMAIGWEEAASIDYLIQNDAALVAYDEKSINEQLQKIVNNTDVLNEYAQKAWECGKRNHQISEIQNNLYNDLQALVNKNR